MHDSILDEVTYYYLESGDFNGITVAQLIEKLSVDDCSLRSGLIDLISNGWVNALSSEDCADLDVQAPGYQSAEQQVAKLSNADSDKTLIYPAAKVLSTFVVPANYTGCPYTLELALGEPPYSYRTFDLRILEFYRNDSRYYYVNDDISGMISVASDSGRENLSELDRPFLKSFGFCYDEPLNRGVAVFLKYLSRLPTDHQSLWKSRELTTSFQIHPDYFRRLTLGGSGMGIPILKALFLEIFLINQMSLAMSRTKLFRTDFGKFCDGVPTSFTFLVRATAGEYTNFILLLDELLLQNIDGNFFNSEMEPEEGPGRPFRNIAVQRKGSLQLLDSWVRKHIPPRFRKKWNEAIESLWHIRSLRLIYSRQHSAQKGSEEVFDPRLFKVQRELVIRAYKAVRTLRVVLANQPNVRKASIDIPPLLSEGKILTI
jgi:hypothetical protein